VNNSRSELGHKIHKIPAGLAGQDPKLLKLWARHGPIKLFWALYGLIMTGHSVTHGCDPPSMALGAAPGSHPPGNTVDGRNPAPPGMVESL